MNALSLKRLRTKLALAAVAMLAFTGVGLTAGPQSASASPPAYIYCGRLTQDTDGQWQYFRTCYNYPTVWYVYHSGTGTPIPQCFQPDQVYTFDQSVYGINTAAVSWQVPLPAPCTF